MKTVITSELYPNQINEIPHYINQLFVVGRNWIPGCQCSHIYRIRHKEDVSIRHHLKNNTILQFVKTKAGDFQSVDDFRLEFYDEIIHFQNEDSWEFFDQEELFA